MAKLRITLGADTGALMSSIRDLKALIGGRNLQLEGDLARQLSELFVDGDLDPSKLIRIDSRPTAGSAGDVTVFFQPSDLFLDLLAALRAGECDDMLIQV